MKKQIFYAALFMALFSACEKQFENSSTNKQKEVDVLVLSGVKPTATSVKTYGSGGKPCVLRIDFL